MENFTAQQKIYKEKLDQNFHFELYNRHNRNFVTRIWGEKFFFSSTGTSGLGERLKWNFNLHPMGASSNDSHTIERDSNGELSFYDGDYETRMTIQKAKEKEEVEHILNLVLEQNNSIYVLISDKEFFLEQMRENIYLYRFDVGESEKSIVKSSTKCFNNFLRSERELANFVNNLTYEQTVKEYPKITTYDLPLEEIKSIVECAISEIVIEKRWGPSISGYKQDVYGEIEERVISRIQENIQKEIDRKKQVIRQKYPIEKLMEIYSSKLIEHGEIEDIKEAVQKAIEDSLRWGEKEEDEFLKDIENSIDKFLQWENRKKDLDDFYELWGSETKFVELTEEKKKKFEDIEKGMAVDEKIFNEYTLYLKLLSAYENFVCRKGKKTLKPTFAVIPIYFEFFKKIASFARETNLIDDRGVFVSWDGFDKFKRKVKKYEKTLVSKK